MAEKLMSLLRVTKRIPTEQYGFDEVMIEETVPTSQVFLRVGELRKKLQEQANGETEGDQGGEEETEQEEEAPKAGKKTRAKKSSPKEKDPEEDEVDEDEIPGDEEEEQEEEKPAKGKKVIKKATTKYSRANELHRKLLGEVLTAKFPSWKKKEDGKEKAGKVSRSLEGKSFLDGDGEVLPEFREEAYQAWRAL